MTTNPINLHSGIISLGELAELSGYPCSQARAFAEKHAGPPTSRRRGGKIALYWRLEPGQPAGAAAHGSQRGGHPLPALLPG